MTGKTKVEEIVDLNTFSYRKCALKGDNTFVENGQKSAFVI
jgi:hypothetical protein